MHLHQSESAAEMTCPADPSAQALISLPVVRLPRAVSEALSDPIVQALMAADGIDREGVEELLRRVIARLSARSRSSR
jgi:hypothetical protein